MKIRLILAPLAAAALILIPLAAKAQEADLAWKPTVGAKRNVAIKIHFSADFGNGSSTFDIAIKTHASVTKVEDGKITIESVADSMTMSMNGQEGGAPPGSDAQSTTTTVYAADGTLISQEQKGGMPNNPRADAVTRFHRPTGKVKLGDSWTWEGKADDAKGLKAAKAKYTVDSEETIDGIACWKVTYAYSESIDDTPMGGTGAFWVSKADGDVAKFEGDLENVRWVEAMPPTSVHLVFTSKAG